MKKVPLLFLFLVLIVLFFIGAFQIYTTKKAEENLRELLSRLGMEGEISYDRISYSPFSGITEVTNLRVHFPEGTTTAERLRITSMTPTSLDLSVQGISPDTEGFRDFLRNMKDLGYEEVRPNLHLLLTLNDRERELTLRLFEIVVPEAFSVGLRLYADRIDSALISALAEAEEDEEVEKLSEQLGRVRLKSLELFLRDLGIRTRILEREARSRNRTPEDILKEVEGELKKGLEEDPEFRKELLKALNSFLLSGGTLRVRANPVPPVDFQTLTLLTLLSLQTGDFSEFVYRLNLRVEHLP